eukprot:15529071-Heterocapsa_arctica.AAC.1
MDEPYTENNDQNNDHPDKDDDWDDYDNEDPISAHASPQQNAKSKAMGKHKIIKLQSTWRESNDLHDIHRLKDIRDHERQDHQWITALNPAE